MDKIEEARFSVAILENPYWIKLTENLQTRYSNALVSTEFKDTDSMQRYVTKLQTIKEINAILKQNVEKLENN